VSKGVDGGGVGRVEVGKKEAYVGKKVVGESGHADIVKVRWFEGENNVSMGLHGAGEGMTRLLLWREGLWEGRRM